jgi:cytochrome c-type biogenesis protein CcmE
MSEPHTASSSEPRSAPDEARASRVRAVKLGAVMLILGGGIAALLTGGGQAADSPFVYSQTVADVVGDPASHSGHTVRVEGTLVDGSVQFREEPCEWRFTLEGTEEQRLPVQFSQCIVPDTFRDGMGVTVVVEGRLESGTFVASQVMTRCPSRYDMEERSRNGEAMPHAAVPAS